MARQWLTVLGDYGAGWDIPDTRIAELATVTDASDATLAKTLDKASRTHVDSVACASIFKVLAARMRYLKNNSYNIPPRSAAELAMLGLAPKKPGSPIPKPKNQVAGITHPLGDHLIEIILEITGDMVRDVPDHGFRVFAGVLDGNAAPGAKGRYGKYLAAPPLDDTDFSWSFLTQRRREIFDYDETDRGKKAYFLVRHETATGLKGPLGPIFWTIIP
jgi:hypothetical protein